MINVEEFHYLEKRKDERNSRLMNYLTDKLNDFIKSCENCISPETTYLKILEFKADSTSFSHGKNPTGKYPIDFKKSTSEQSPRSMEFYTRYKSSSSMI